MRLLVSRIVAALLIPALLLESGAAEGAFQPLSARSPEHQTPAPLFAEQAVVQALRTYFKERSTFYRRGGIAVTQEENRLRLQVLSEKLRRAKKWQSLFPPWHTPATARFYPDADRYRTVYSFNDIRELVLNEPYQDIWAAEGSEPLDLGDWVNDQMSLRSLLEGLQQRGRPELAPFENALEQKTQALAALRAFDGDVVRGIPSLSAQQIRATMTAYLRSLPLDPPIREIRLFADAGAGTFYLARQGNDLEIRPDSDPALAVVEMDNAIVQANETLEDAETDLAQATADLETAKAARALAESAVQQATQIQLDNAQLVQEAERNLHRLRRLRLLMDPPWSGRGGPLPVFLFGTTLASLIWHASQGRVGTLAGVDLPYNAAIVLSVLIVFGLGFEYFNRKFDKMINVLSRTSKNKPKHLASYRFSAAFSGGAFVLFTLLLVAQVLGRSLTRYTFELLTGMLMVSRLSLYVWAKAIRQQFDQANRRNLKIVARSEIRPSVSDGHVGPILVETPSTPILSPVDSKDMSVRPDHVIWAGKRFDHGLNEARTREVEASLAYEQAKHALHANSEDRELRQRLLDAWDRLKEARMMRTSLEEMHGGAQRSARRGPLGGKPDDSRHRQRPRDEKWALRPPFESPSGRWRFNSDADKIRERIRIETVQTEAAIAAGEQDLLNALNHSQLVAGHAQAFRKVQFTIQQLREDLKKLRRTLSRMKKESKLAAKGPALTIVLAAALFSTAGLSAFPSIAFSVGVVALAALQPVLRRRSAASNPPSAQSLRRLFSAA